jgi:hypothetical protein
MSDKATSPSRFEPTSEPAGGAQPIHRSRPAALVVGALAFATPAGLVAMAILAIVVTLAFAPARAQAPSALPNPSDPQDTVGPPAAEAPARTGTNVRIVFKVIPPSRATVTWGKKKMGFIKPRAPLVVERPRDSGPLDVVVRAEDCVPVHTRAYTFTDSTVVVKVTPVDKKNTIFGYREVPPPEADGGIPGTPGGADGGVPPPAAP